MRLNEDYLFIKGQLNNHTITLASMYVPNEDQISFITHTLNKLTQF